MADSERAETQPEEETNGHEGNGGARKAVVRAAAIAAASGATALAAKKAFSDRGSTGSDDERSSRRSRGGDGSVLSSVVSSAWDSARETVVPMIEDAAEHAGAYLARNGPEVVRETIVPRFIRGFERAQESASED
jgi:hypothetical protein